MTTVFVDDINKLSERKESLYDSGYIAGQKEDSDIEFVSFSGGGVSGFSLGGVYKELERRKIKDNVKYWLGSSAGAIIASLAALNAPSDYVIKHFMDIDIHKVLDYGGISQSDISLGSKFMSYKYGIPELMSKLGAVRGDYFNEWFQRRMIDLGWSNNTTFADLYNKTGKHLVITATSLNTSETLYLSRSSYPYMRIADAVRASWTLPFIIQPIHMNDPILSTGERMLVDGGILDNFPLNACDIISDSGDILAFNRKAIGFTLVSRGRWSPDYVKIDNLINYSLSFIRSMHNRIHSIQSHQPYYWDRVIPIEIFDVSSISFNTDKKVLSRLIDSGTKCSSIGLDKRAMMIAQQGPLPRNLFIPNPTLRCPEKYIISDDLIENTQLYQTNPEKFLNNKIPYDKIMY